MSPLVLGDYESPPSPGMNVRMHYRMYNEGVCSHAGGRFYTYVKPGSVQDFPSMLSDRLFSPGTYEWQGKMTNEANHYHYMGFERHHGYPSDGIICFRIGNTTYTTQCGTGGNFDGAGAVTTDNPAAQDWTVDRTFKIIWTAGTSVLFYIDGALISTINTNVPTLAMQFFIETGVLGGPFASHAVTELIQDTFRRL